MGLDTHIHGKGELSLPDLLKRVRANPDFWRVGALAIFIGVVRGEGLEGARVEELEVEAYEEGAEKALARICEDLKGRSGVVDVQIHHFTGRFRVGEDLVYVLVAGSHRQDVFPTLVEAVERYKREAPIFKKEYVVDERGSTKSYWVSERELAKRSRTPTR